ncbi:MAG: ABC transporter permease, partial [Tunicatimonas sp.]
MLTNYLKIALRTLRKKPFYTGINILGLAIGMAACLLISLYVLDELSYDRFHEKADRIYRVTTQTDFNGRESQMASTSYHIGEVIGSEIPEIETTVRVQQLWEQPVKNGEERYAGQQALGVDSTFFRVFTFPLREGNPTTALKEPGSVVLTERLAEIIFGQASGVVGQTLVVAGELREVSAVAENPPRNAHFHFDMLVPFVPRTSERVDWTNVNGLVSTYLLLAEEAFPQSIPDKLHQLMLKYNPKAAEFIASGEGDMTFTAQPVTDIHLHSDLGFELEGNGNVQYVYIFGAIALFILIIAVINFVNLSTARSADRAKEVGVRKTLGSARSALVGQFLTESLLVSFIAMLLALGLAEIFRRPFNDLAAKNLTLNVAEGGSLGITILVIALVVGVIAGLYPAIYLTKFKPVTVLRGRLATGRQGRTLRNLLVIFQCATTIGLIVFTGLVYQQLQYIQNN